MKTDNKSNKGMHVNDGCITTKIVNYGIMIKNSLGPDWADTLINNTSTQPTLDTYIDTTYMQCFQLIAAIMYLQFKTLKFFMIIIRKTYNSQTNKFY